MYFRRGFTLIELLVTMAIVSILVSIVYVSFGDSRDNSRNRAMMVELKEVQLALETYQAQNGSYPIPDTSCRTTSGGDLVATEGSCGNLYISEIVPELIDELPLGSDSANASCSMEYRTDPEGNWYKLTAINCLGGVNEVTGISQNEPLARCSTACTNNSNGDTCYEGDADYYASFAVYSLGGQCE